MLLTLVAVQRRQVDPFSLNEARTGKVVFLRSLDNTFALSSSPLPSTASPSRSFFPLLKLPEDSSSHDTVHRLPLALSPPRASASSLLFFSYRARRSSPILVFAFSSAALRPPRLSLSLPLRLDVESPPTTSSKLATRATLYQMSSNSCHVPCPRPSRQPFAPTPCASLALL